MSERTYSTQLSKEMVQPTQHDGRYFNGYRLQTSAYAQHREPSPLFQSSMYLSNHRLGLDAPHYTHVFPENNNLNVKLRRNSTFYTKHEHKSKSLLQLPIIVTEDTADNAYHSATSSQCNITSDVLANNARKQSHLSNFTTSESALTNTSRSVTARLSMTSAADPRTHKNKRRRFSLEDDPNRLAMKISLPCTGGCCYCVYTTLLGPVKVYFKRVDKPKTEPLLMRIKDGNGKPVIPISRKSDVKGLVYDPKSCSLHPPVKGQRSVLKNMSTLKNRSNTHNPNETKTKNKYGFK